MDKHGKIVVWQNPNLPLWVWATSTIVSKILSYRLLIFAAALILFGSLFTWTRLEISQGASPFRRALGALVLTYSILLRL